MKNRFMIKWLLNKFSDTTLISFWDADSKKMITSYYSVKSIPQECPEIFENYYVKDIEITEDGMGFILYVKKVADAEYKDKDIPMVESYKGDISLRDYLLNFSGDAVVDICDDKDAWNIFIEYTSVSQVERVLKNKGIEYILDGKVIECRASSSLDSFFIYIDVVAPVKEDIEDKEKEPQILLEDPHYTVNDVKVGQHIKVKKQDIGAEKFTGEKRDAWVYLIDEDYKQIFVTEYQDYFNEPATTPRFVDGVWIGEDDIEAVFEDCLEFPEAEDSIDDDMTDWNIGDEKEYGPSNPWDAPGMKKSDFI